MKVEAGVMDDDWGHFPAPSESSMVSGKSGILCNCRWNFQKLNLCLECCERKCSYATHLLIGDTTKVISLGKSHSSPSL